MFNTPEKYKKLVRPTISLKKVSSYPQAVILNSYSELNSFIKDFYYIESATEFESFIELDYEYGPVAFLLKNKKFTPYFKPKIHTLFTYKNKLTHLPNMVSEATALSRNLVLSQHQRYIVYETYEYKEIYYQLNIDKIELGDSILNLEDFHVVEDFDANFDEKNDFFINKNKHSYLINLFGNDYHKSHFSLIPVYCLKKKRIINDFHFIKLITTTSLNSVIINSMNWIPMYQFFSLSPTFQFPKSSILNISNLGRKIFVLLNSSRIQSINTLHNHKLIICNKPLQNISDSLQPRFDGYTTAYNILNAFDFDAFRKTAFPKINKNTAASYIRKFTLFNLEEVPTIFSIQKKELNESPFPKLEKHYLSDSIEPFLNGLLTNIPNDANTTSMSFAKLNDFKNSYYNISSHFSINSIYNNKLYISPISKLAEEYSLEILINFN